MTKLNLASLAASALLIEAAAFAAQGEPPASTTPPSTVSGVTVTAPASAKPPAADVAINMQGSTDDIEQQIVVWPAGAYETRANGRVTLRCQIDVHGLAERCDVAYEWPQGLGFGKAAMVLRPTFKLAPTLGPNGPIATTKNIQISFRAPDHHVSGADVALAMTDMAMMDTLTFAADRPLDLRKVTIIENPLWAAAANFEDLANAYPAKGGDVEGYAVDHCMVARSGVLHDCVTTKEEPEGRGFGKAALALAPKFKVTRELADAPHRTPQVWVDVPIRFPPPQERADHTVMAPTWITAIDSKASPRLFPPEAVARGLVTGRGVVRCTVDSDGSMTSCVPEPGDPDGLGFSEAAAKLAPGLKMNLWSADGAPVQGGVVHIPIRLNLKAPNG